MVESIVMNENEISKIIVESAMEVHRNLGGPGLLESVYQEALVWELSQHNLSVEREKIIPITYKEQILGTPLRLDLLIDEKVIVECKASVNYNHIFEAQLLTYLRLTGLKLGMVINFGEKLIKNGLHRVVNGLY